MLCCTFAGHREVFQRDVGEAVEATLHELLEKDSEFCFYTGGMGEFDELCAQKVRQLRKTQSEKHIKLILVEPYMKQSINTERTWLLSRYDDIIVPEEIAGIHYKAAIIKRNQWMIEQSQHLIAYVRRDFGGAYTTLRYAQRKGLHVIRV